MVNNLSGRPQGGDGQQNGSRGTCSPRAKLPASWPGAPPGAVSLCWANPIEGVSKLDSLAQLGFASVSHSPEQSFFAYGGFLLLDEQGTVITVQAVGVGEDLIFDKPRPWRDTFTRFLDESGRTRPVTLPLLLRGGASEFCWIAPQEELTDGSERWVPSQVGAFLYKRSGGDPALYFPLSSASFRADGFGAQLIQSISRQRSGSAEDTGAGGRSSPLKWLSRLGSWRKDAADEKPRSQSVVEVKVGKI